MTSELIKTTLSTHISRPAVFFYRVVNYTEEKIDPGKTM